MPAPIITPVVPDPSPQTFSFVDRSHFEFHDQARLEFRDRTRFEFHE